MRVMVEIHNVPVNVHTYCVVTLVDGELWFDTSWRTTQEALAHCRQNQMVVIAA